MLFIWGCCYYHNYSFICSWQKLNPKKWNRIHPSMKFSLLVVLHHGKPSKLYQLILCLQKNNINLLNLGSSEADAVGCHCCQCSTPKRLTLISRVEFSFLKMLWIRFSNLSESSWGRNCGEMLPYAGGTFFRIVPFLIQFAIPCNVLTKRISLFWQLARIFSELLYAACSKAMAFRTVGKGQ